MENYDNFYDMVKRTSFYLDERIRSEIYIKEMSGWARCSSNFRFHELSLGVLYNYYDKAFISTEINPFTGIITKIKQVCLITVEGEFIVFNSWESFKEYIVTNHKN